LEKSKYAYMCLVDYNWELGEALGGVVLYPTLKDLQENQKCVDKCGVVRVKIILDKTIQESDFKGKGFFK